MRVLDNRIGKSRDVVTFVEWIDEVNGQVRARLGNEIRTQELSWDSAVWVSPTGTVVAQLADDEKTAKIAFDGGERLSLAFRTPEAAPRLIGEAIAKRLTSR
jgi:hypothetical protein